MPAFSPLTDFLDRIIEAKGSSVRATLHVEGGTDRPAAVVRGAIGKLEMADLEGGETPVAFVPIVNADQDGAEPPAGIPVDTSMVAKVEVLEAPTKTAYRVWCRKSVVTFVFE